MALGVHWEVCLKESVVAFAFLAVKFEHWIQIIDLLEVTFDSCKLMRHLCLNTVIRSAPQFGTPCGKGNEEKEMTTNRL